MRALYYFTDEVYGYSEEEALALARTLYDEGVWPASYLKVVRVHPLDDGRWRAYVVVTKPDGHPAAGLDLEDFERVTFTATLDDGSRVSASTDQF